MFWKNKTNELKPAEIELLISFRYGKDIDNLNKEKWNLVLNQEITETISKLTNMHLIKEGDIVHKIEYSYKLTDLKLFLKSMGQRTSGNKPELASLAATFTNDKFVKDIAKKRIFLLSSDGEQKSNEYHEFKKVERNEAETKTLESLTRGEFKTACLAMAEYEVKQVFSRGLGIDWNEYDPKWDIFGLIGIFAEPIKILEGIPTDAIKHFQIAGAMQYLWGTGNSKKWLPDNLHTNYRLDNNTIARMFCFKGYYSRNIASYKESNVVIGVRVLSSQDCCDECKKISGKGYAFPGVIELPYEKCTSEKGCRCTTIAILEGQKI